MKQHLQQSLAALSLKKLTSGSAPQKNNNKMENEDNNVDIRTKGESVSINLQKRSNVVNLHVDEIEKHCHDDEGEIDYFNIDRDIEVRYTDDQDESEDESEGKTNGLQSNPSDVKTNGKPNINAYDN